MRSASVSAEASFQITLERAINDYRGPETVFKNGTAVPGFLVDSFNFLEKHKYHEHEGVFRKEGSRSRMSCLSSLVMGDLTLDTLKDVTVIDVCCLVKKFLRSLDQPLLHNLQKKLVDSINPAQSSQDRVVERMVLTLIDSMDSKVITTLSYLMTKLSELLAHENKTKMGAVNLGSMFAPCLFGSQLPTSALRSKVQNKTKPSAPMEAQKHNADRQSRVIEILIQNCSQIGPPGAAFSKSIIDRSQFNLDRENKGKEKRSSSVARIFIKNLPKFRRSSSTNRRSSVESASSSHLSLTGLTSKSSKLIERRPSNHVVTLTSSIPLTMDISDEDVFKPPCFQESSPQLPSSPPPPVSTSPSTPDSLVSGFKTIVSVKSPKDDSPDAVSISSRRSRVSSPRRGNVNAAATTRTRSNRSNRNVTAAISADLAWPSPAPSMEPVEMESYGISSIQNIDRHVIVKRNSTELSTNSVERLKEKSSCHEDSLTNLSQSKTKADRGNRRHTAPIRLIQRNQPNTLKNGLDKKVVRPVRRATVIYSSNSEPFNDENCEQPADAGLKSSMNDLGSGINSLTRKRRPKKKNSLKSKAAVADKNAMILDVSAATEDTELGTKKPAVPISFCQPTISNKPLGTNTTGHKHNDDHLFKQPLLFPMKAPQRKKEVVKAANPHVNDDWVHSTEAELRIEQAKCNSSNNRPSVVACEASGIVRRRIEAFECDNAEEKNREGSEMFTASTLASFTTTFVKPKPTGPPAYRVFQQHPASHARTGQVTKQTKVFEHKVPVLRLKNNHPKSPGRALKSTPRKSIGERKENRHRMQTRIKPVSRFPFSYRRFISETAVCDENQPPPAVTEETNADEHRRNSVLPFSSIGARGFGGSDNSAPLTVSSVPPLHL